MSKIADDVGSKLKDVFPRNVIKREHYVNYKGTQLFFDFYIKDLGILIEIQGRQHFKFIKHFHGTVDNFKAQKHRDNLKKEYIQDNVEMCLVYFYDEKDKVNDELILRRIYEAQNKEEGV